MFFPDIIGPPIAGYLADKLGNFRLFMAIVTFLVPMLSNLLSLSLIVLWPIKLEHLLITSLFTPDYICK
jgi:hypothetical protein